MRKRTISQHIKILTFCLAALLFLSACPSDRPYSLGDRGDSGSSSGGSSGGSVGGFTATGGGGTGGSTTVGGGGSIPEGACVMANVPMVMEMRISANPKNPGVNDDDAIDKVDDVYPVPFNSTWVFEPPTSGNLWKVTWFGEDLNLIPSLGSFDNDGEMVIKGVAGQNAVGTLDPETGHIDIPEATGLGIKVSVEVFGLDTYQVQNLPRLALSTQSGLQAPGNGPSSPIVIDGQPLDGNNEFVVASAFQLSSDLGEGLLNENIGGGSMAATFAVSLPGDPTDPACSGGGVSTGGVGTTTTGGGTDGGGTDGGGDPAEGIELTDSNGSKVTNEGIDFGVSEVVVQLQDGDQKLDCDPNSNRDGKVLWVTITNPFTDKELHIQDIIVKDVDADIEADDGCELNKDEFHRGSIEPLGEADCEYFEVLNTKIYEPNCVLPPFVENEEEEDDLAETTGVRFLIRYSPENFIQAEEGESIPTDLGVLVIPFNDGEGIISVPLSAKTVRSARDDFSLIPDPDGTPVLNGGQYKISKVGDILDPVPMFLVNKGVGDWEVKSVELSSETDDQQMTYFGIDGLNGQKLAPYDEMNPEASKAAFTIAFTPPDGNQPFSANDQLIVKLEDNTDPQNPIPTTVRFNLVGTDNIEPLSGKWTLNPKYFAALVADPLLDGDPLTGPDYRYTLQHGENPDYAPLGIPINFDGDGDIKSVDIDPFTYDYNTFMGLQPQERLTKVINLHSSRYTNEDGSSFDSDKGPIDPDTMNPNCIEPSPAQFQDAYDVNHNPPFCSRFFFLIEKGPNFAGTYIDSTGHIVLSNLIVKIWNPFHGQLYGGSVHKASDPLDNPSNIIKQELTTTLTTMTIDRQKAGPNNEYILVPGDSNVSILNVQEAAGEIQEEFQGNIISCPEGWPDQPSDAYDPFDYSHNVNKWKEKKPIFNCFLKDEKFIKGSEVRIRPGTSDVYDVVLSGIVKLDNSPNNPPFMKNRHMYFIMLGTLEKDGGDNPIINPLPIVNNDNNPDDEPLPLINNGN